MCSSLFFFRSMSIHLSTAILAHLFSYDMYAFALLALCSLLMRIVFFLGHEVQPEKKSNVPLFGLKVGLFFNDVDNFEFL